MHLIFVHQATIMHKPIRCSQFEWFGQAEQVGCFFTKFLLVILPDDH